MLGSLGRVLKRSGSRAGKAAAGVAAPSVSRAAAASTARAGMSFEQGLANMARRTGATIGGPAAPRATARAGMSFEQGLANMARRTGATIGGRPVPLATAGLSMPPPSFRTTPYPGAGMRRGRGASGTGATASKAITAPAGSTSGTGATASKAITAAAESTSGTGATASKAITAAAESTSGTGKTAKKTADPLFRERNMMGMRLTARTQKGIVLGGATAAGVMAFGNRRQSGTSRGTQSMYSY